MSYYPAWLDYAGVVFGAAGVLCGRMMASEPTGRRRGFLNLAVCELIAIGIGFLATGGILFNLHAPHIIARGDVFDVVQHTGRSSSTKFRLGVPTGEIDGLHLSSAIKEITDGETAEVEYQAGSCAVLDIRIIEGPYAGYETSNSDGMTGAVFCVLVAIVLAIYGILNWVSDGTAVSYEFDNRPQPDGDVDSKSMLHLSSRAEEDS